MTSKEEENNETSSTSLNEEQIEEIKNSRALKWKERAEHFESKYRNAKRTIADLKKKLQKLEMIIIVKDQRIKELRN
jgi:hypothetical protein